MEADVITLQDIFEFQVDSIVDRRVNGALLPTGLRPGQMTKFERRSIAVSADLFVRDESFGVVEKRERR